MMSRYNPEINKFYPIDSQKQNFSCGDLPIVYTPEPFSSHCPFIEFYPNVCYLLAYGFFQLGDKFGIVLVNFSLKVTLEIKF